MGRPVKINPAPNDLVTVHQTSKMLGTSPRRVRALAMGGALHPVFTNGGKQGPPSFVAKDVIEFFHQHRHRLAGPFDRAREPR